MRKLVLTFILPAFMFFSVSAVAEIEDRYVFANQQEQALFQALTLELRCPKCQNQNIADSNAAVAVDLRNKTYQLVTEGKSKDEIVDFMVLRYGQFVHYSPPINWITIWLWLLPMLMVVGLAWGLIARRQQQQTQDVDQAALEQAEAILKNVQSGSRD